MRPPHAQAHPVELAFAAGLLLLGLVGCLASAFGFAAIGAERELTPNLPAATLYSGVAASIGVVAIIAAFAVLADLYLAPAVSLFVMITVGVQIVACALVALVLSDSWQTFAQLGVRGADQGEQVGHASTRHWLADRDSAYRASYFGIAATAVALIAAFAVHAAGGQLRLGETTTNAFVVAGVVLVVAAFIISMLRTMHRPSLYRLGIERREAIGVLVIVTGYFVTLTLCLP